MGRPDVATRNLELVNAPRTADYHKRIQTTLADFKKKGLVFVKYGKLLENVASSTGIHRTNLRRNLAYSTLISAHFLGQKGGVGILDENGAPPVALLSIIRQQKLDLLALRRELRETQAGLENAISGSWKNQEGAPSEPKDEVQLDHVDFVNLSKLVLELIERSDGAIELNYERMTLVDLVAPPSQREFAKPPQTTKFIKWAKGHAAQLETMRQLRRFITPDGKKTR
ncbi:hypothetical protein OKW40_002424 [Paraburkholderia sp. RAU6.4a]|uniref:hypothetical protein n=1 Tax=Paraburkholderia sp. RAU6.4a TaxID=2991067 RepID=UPI003D205BA7